MTVFMRCCEEGYETQVDLLLKYNPELDHKNGDGMSAIVFAVRNCMVDAVVAMIERGCDLNVTDEEGRFLTAIAVSSTNSSSVEIIKALHKANARFDYFNEEGYSLLLQAQNEECSNYIAENKLVDIDH